MGPTFGFWLAFATTVVLLVVSLVSGLLGRRRVHLVTGPLTMVMLGVAVLLTEQLMRGYRFPVEEMKIHLMIAKTAAALGLVVVATGVWLWRRPTARRWHKLAVWLFVVLTLVATGTGIWVFGLSEPL